MKRYERRKWIYNSHVPTYTLYIILSPRRLGGVQCTRHTHRPQTREYHNIIMYQARRHDAIFYQQSRGVEDKVLIPWPDIYKLFGIPRATPSPTLRSVHPNTHVICFLLIKIDFICAYMYYVGGIRVYILIYARSILCIYN